MQTIDQIRVEFQNGTLHYLKYNLLQSFVNKWICRPNYKTIGEKDINIKGKTRIFSNSGRHSFFFLIFEIYFHKMGQVTKQKYYNNWRSSHKFLMKRNYSKTPNVLVHSVGSRQVLASCNYFLRLWHFSLCCYLLTT